MTEMYASAMANNVLGLNEDILQRHYPIHWACYHGNEAYLRELLMSAGADHVYQEDGLFGWTPMHWAAAQGKWKCLELIKQISPVDLDVTVARLNQTPTHIAAQYSQAECIAWLRQQGVSMGMQDHMGDTPLHKAAQTGRLDCVKLLISHGPVLSTFNHRGQTPMDVAVQSGNEEVMRYLDEALASQHSSLLPTASSPILMNGEGIYQNGVGTKRTAEGDQDMEMGGDIGNNGDATTAAAVHAAFHHPAGHKRSFDSEEEMPMKRRRLFAPSSCDKLGSFNNNNVLSSYQGILATSVEPLRTPAVQEPSDMNEGSGMDCTNKGQTESSQISEHPRGSRTGGIGVCARREYDYRCAALRSHMI